MNPTAIIALVIIVVSALMMAVFAFLAQRTRFAFREIEAFKFIRRAVSMVVEDGSRLHVSLGRGSLLTPFGAAALAGLAMLRRLAETTSTSDRPPIATSGDGLVNLLSQETLRTAHEITQKDKPFDFTQARMTGLTPFSYAAGVMPYIRDDEVSTNVLIGSYGIEVGLLTEASEREGAAVIAASDHLPAQAVLYATTPGSLIGEELFASGAYNQAGNFHTASLVVQDILRWIIIIVILAGIVLKLFGAL
ncbi:MAG: hypothetical protein CVU44_23135 [Chloroflexi bacterium HGW-Chloroflexi-6]|nr:MAG: hypothetical protein CVU44_23135 [Chloroflexi bacterium HGW-Chloroflexi-6]